MPHPLQHLTDHLAKLHNSVDVYMQPQQNVGPNHMAFQTFQKGLSLEEKASQQSHYRSLLDYLAQSKMSVPEIFNDYEPLLDPRFFKISDHHALVFTEPGTKALFLNMCQIMTITDYGKSNNGFYYNECYDSIKTRSALAVLGIIGPKLASGHTIGLVEANDWILNYFRSIGHRVETCSEDKLDDKYKKVHDAIQGTLQPFMSSKTALIFPLNQAEKKLEQPDEETALITEQKINELQIAMSQAASWDEHVTILRQALDKLAPDIRCAVLHSQWLSTVLPNLVMQRTIALLEEYLNALLPSFANKSAIKKITGQGPDLSQLSQADALRLIEPLKSVIKKLDVKNLHNFGSDIRKLDMAKFKRALAELISKDMCTVRQSNGNYWTSGHWNIGHQTEINMALYLGLIPVFRQSITHIEQRIGLNTDESTRAVFWMMDFNGAADNKQSLAEYHTACFDGKMRRTDGGIFIREDGRYRHVPLKAIDVGASQGQYSPKPASANHTRYYDAGSVTVGLKDFYANLPHFSHVFRTTCQFLDNSKTGNELAKYLKSSINDDLNRWSNEDNTLVLCRNQNSYVLLALCPSQLDGQNFPLIPLYDNITGGGVLQYVKREPDFEHGNPACDSGPVYICVSINKMPTHGRSVHYRAIKAATDRLC